MINLDGCGFSNLTIDATTVMYNITFYILMPTYLTAGLLLNFILTVGMLKQAKSEGSYVYQLSIVASKTTEGITFGLYIGPAYWCVGLGGVTVDWFTANYWLMYGTMRLMLPAYFFCFTNSIFFSVATSADRVFALSKPFDYKQIDHKKHQKIALIVSLLVSAILCVDNYFYYAITPVGDTGHYKVSINAEYIGTTLSQVLEILRTSVRGGAILALIVLNVIMIVAYNRHMSKLKHMANNKERAEARKEANKELFLLSSCQSFLTCLDQFPLTVMLLIRKWAPQCGLVLAPIVVGSTVVSDLGEFFVILAVNKKVREQVKKMLRYEKWFCANAVAPINR